MNTQSKEWQRTSPFAILFFIGKIVRIIAQNAWQTIAPLAVYVSVSQENLVTSLIIGGIAIAILIAVGSVLSWLFFRYQILADSVLIRSGVLQKKQLDIKFDRIQGVNTKQNPIYRYLNLVTVEFETAGSAGSEGNLPAVTKEFANDLRDQIGKSGASVVASTSPASTTTDALIRLSWTDMIRIGLADRRALIVFALVGPLAEQMGDEIEAFVEQALMSAAFGATQIGVSTGVLIFVAIVVGALLLFALFSITAAFLRYHNFELFLDGRTLRSYGGLLTKHEHSMDLEKIQTLRLQQGIIQSWMKRFRMTARQATSGRQHQGGKQKMFTIPVVTASEADQLRPLLFANEAGRLTQDPRSNEFKPVSRYYMRSRILFIGLLPAIVLALFFFGEIGSVGLIALLWLPIVAALSWRNWQRAGYQFDKDEIVRRSGLLGFRTVGLLFRKVQRVTVTQSRYQRRKGLASLRMYMASGKVSVPYIEHELAQQLRDYILYRVESSQRAWH